MREKTKNAIALHLAALKPSDKYILLGDSHCERLIWKHPELAPKDTWICAVGGDSVPRLAYRVKNQDGTGYSQAASVGNQFQKLFVLIGGNDLKNYIMKPAEIETVADGIDHLAAVLKKRWPLTYLLILPVLPPPSHSDKPRVNYDRLNDILRVRGMITGSVSWDDLTDADYIDHGHFNGIGYAKFLTKLNSLGLNNSQVPYGGFFVPNKKTSLERRVGLLQKKLKTIDAIQSAVARGDKVEKTQLEMVGRKQDIEDELKSLKEWCRTVPCPIFSQMKKLMFFFWLILVNSNVNPRSSWLLQRAQQTAERFRKILRDTRGSWTFANPPNLLCGPGRARPSGRSLALDKSPCR